VGGGGSSLSSFFDTTPPTLESIPPRFGRPGHHDGMTDTSAPQDLEAIRARLDVVDRRLVDVLTERAGLIAEVIHYKRAHAMGVVDRPREEQMLDRVGDIAAQGGLDPRIARRVLRSVIDAFTLLEVEQLGPDV
jgi:isochorismate pyruvate lyase